MTDDTELRAYVEAEFAELSDAIGRKDAEAVTRIIRHMGAEGDPRLAAWVEREIAVTGLTRLAERAGTGDPKAMEDLTEALGMLFPKE